MFPHNRQFCLGEEGWGPEIRGITQFRSKVSTPGSAPFSGLHKWFDQRTGKSMPPVFEALEDDRGS